MAQRIKRALPRVSQPYELVRATLALLAAGPRSDTEVRLELESASSAEGRSLHLSEVDDWLGGALALVERRAEVYRLTEQGEWLAQVLGTPIFDCRFLAQLLARGSTQFSYFNKAHRSLMGRRARGDNRIEVQELNTQLNLVLANKTSGPVIRRLLLGLGILVHENGAYRIEEICQEGNEISPELHALLSRAEQLIRTDSLSFNELRERLKLLLGDSVLLRNEEQLRAHLRIAATRSVEWVVGIDWEGSTS